MAQINHILKLTTFILIVVFSTSCNNLKLNDEEAKKLITETLTLPQSFNENVTGANIFVWDKAMKEGFIYDPGNCSWGCTLQATEKSTPYLISDKITGNGGYYNYNTLTFKGFDIDFGQVLGIAINKEQGTATVRFSLVSTNISPVGRALENNIDNPRNGELIYKKFDNGWQLSSEQNKAGIDMVKELWWGRH
jgi:hypothetical protein